MALASTIGALSVVIGGDTGPLRKALGDAEQQVDKFEASLDTAVSAATALAAGVAVAGAAVAAMVKRSLANADAVHKMAQSAGVATGTFSELAFAAKLAGVNQEALSTALARANRNIADAAAGTGDAVRAFEALGISVKNADGSLKSADQIMAEVAERFAGMEDGASKSALAMMIFGRAGAQMIPLLNQGAQGLASAREEARLLGVAIDSEAGRAAEKFNDNLARLGAVLEGFGNKLAKEFVGPLGDATDQLVEAAKYSKEFRDTIDSAVKFIKGTALTVFQTFAVVGSDIAFVFRMLGGEIGAIAAQFGAIARLDFAGARLIGEEWTRDAAQARKDLDEFQKRIMTLGEKPALTADLLSDELGASKPQLPKSKGPKIKSNEELNAQEKENAEWLRLVMAREEETKKAAERELAILFKKHDEKVALGEKALEQVRKELATEEQLELESQARKLEGLRAALETNQITQSEFDALAEQAELTHQERLTAIQEKGLTERQKFQRISMRDQAKTIFGELANITAGVSQHNKKLFEINKVAGIANAIINAYTGISKTLAAYPFPINVALAAVHAAAAFAQVSAIRSQTFGGGGGTAPALAGGTAATPVTPVGGGTGGGVNGQTTIINLQGDTFDRKAVRNLVEQINENTADGGKVIFG